MKQTNIYYGEFVQQRLTARALAACVCSLSRAQNSIGDLTKASLEELANTRVASVSKREKSPSNTGAAVFVITQEGVRRFGMMNIPEMAPGVNVARLDSSAWAIGIRGFSDRYSNKVLVLIDGVDGSEVFPDCLRASSHLPCAPDAQSGVRVSPMDAAPRTTRSREALCKGRGERL